MKWITMVCEQAQAAVASMQQKLLIESKTYYIITSFNYCIASVDGHTPPAQLRTQLKSQHCMWVLCSPFPTSSDKSSMPHELYPDKTYCSSDWAISIPFSGYMVAPRTRWQHAPQHPQFHGTRTHHFSCTGSPTEIKQQDSTCHHLGPGQRKQKNEWGLLVHSTSGELRPHRWQLTQFYRKLSEDSCSVGSRSWKRNHREN